MAKIRIHDLATGKIIDRDGTQAEIEGVPNPNGLQVEHLTEIITPNQLEEQTNDQSL